MTLVDLALMVMTSPASYMATREACGAQMSASKTANQLCMRRKRLGEAACSHEHDADSATGQDLQDDASVTYGGTIATLDHSTA